MELLSLKNNEEKIANGIKICKRLENRICSHIQTDATRINIQKRLRLRL